MSVNPIVPTTVPFVPRPHALVRRAPRSAAVVVLLVIYLRYSSDLQRSESCDDQERQIREGLARKGIDHSQARVIKDEAMSGERADRPGWQQLRELSRDPQYRMTLAVDDQGRLSRDCNVRDMIVDLKFNGGRFLSIGEGIDSDAPGWELLVKVMEIHHHHANSERARQCRRGQEGRVLDSDGSAGDYPFGYTSVPVDEAATLNYTGRGPRPRKRVIIDDTQADAVRRAFRWFVDENVSLSKIGGRLTALGVPKGHRAHRKKTPTRTRWTHHEVRSMLCNPKYIGEWTWGLTCTIRDSGGRKKQVPAPADRVRVMQRPNLRIIDQPTWDRAQVRLAQLHETYGFKPGQKSRRPRSHRIQLYPPGLLNGLLVCKYCGRRLHAFSNGRGQAFGCPDRCTGPSQRGLRVPAALAEQRLLEFITALFSAWPEWLARAFEGARSRVQDLQTRVPGALAADEQRLAEIRRKIANLVDQLADGTPDSAALRQRLHELEDRQRALAHSVEEQRELLHAPVDLPSDDWMRAQLPTLGGLLTERTPRAAMFVRALIGPVHVSVVCPPGKARGYAQLRFRVNAWEAISAALGDRVPAAVLVHVAPRQDAQTQSPEFVIDLGEPTRLDKLAPQIDQLRAAGVSWNELGRRLGVRPGNAWTAWNRWKKAQNEGQST